MNLLIRSRKKQKGIIHTRLTTMGDYNEAELLASFTLR